MEADPWRNPFADEDSARQRGSKPQSSTATSLAWTRSTPSSETLAEPAVSSPAASTSPAWIPSSDVADSVWTWESTSKPTPASPKWESVAFESRTWSPPPPPLDDAFPSGKDAGFHKVDPEPTVSAVLSSPPVEPSSWSGDDSSSVDVHLRTPSPLTPRQEPAVTPSFRSPDEFGSFEAGETRTQTLAADDDVDIPWSSSAGAIHYDQAAPTTWGSTVPAVEASTPVEPDQWQSATEAREQRDLVAPPHVVNGWNREMQSLLDIMWKPPKTDDTMSNWRGSASVLDDVSSMMDTVLPPLHLERPPDLSKTAIHKASITALKLTRHSTVAQSSPLAIFQAMRGSTSWEESVKKHVNPIAHGWGIFDTEEPASKPRSPVAPTAEVKKSSGLLSFFSRKDITPSTPTPSQAAVVPTPSTGTQTIASARSEKANGELKMASTDKTDSEGARAPKALSDTSATSTTGQFAGGRSSPTADEDGNPELSAPSAVSRFLGRLTRNKSDEESHKPLSLSDADVSFFSDAVAPTGSANHTLSSVGPFELDGSLLEPASLPKVRNSTPSFPPLLAPPVSSTRTSATTTPVPNSPLVAPPVKPSLASSSTKDDDIWDVFSSTPNPAPSSPPVTYASPPPLSRPIPVSTASAINNSSENASGSVAAASTMRRTVPVRLLSYADQPVSASTIPTLLPPPRRALTPVPRSLNLSAETQGTAVPSSRTNGDLTASPVSGLSPATAEHDVVLRRMPPRATERSVHTPGTGGSSHDSSLLLKYESGFPGALNEFGDFAVPPPLPSQVVAVTTPKRAVDTGTGRSAKRASVSNLGGERSRTSSTSSPIIPPTIQRSNTNSSNSLGTVNLNFDFLRTASPSVTAQSNPPAAPQVSARGRSSIEPRNIHPFPPPPAPSSRTFTPIPTSPILSTPTGSSTSRLPTMTRTLSPQSTGGSAKPGKSAVPAGKSGLSAQDLSFFENL